MQTASEVIPLTPAHVKISEKDVERFWRKVSKDGPIPSHRPELGNCWTWTAGLNEYGYGSFWLKGKNVGAHRVSWIIAHGEIPEGLSVLHHCDNPRCVRHLFTGTQADNRADCCAKGRQAKGEKTIAHNPQRGDDHFSHRHPELIPRGDRHYARTNPEKLARGDRHGSKLHPESVARGDRNGSNTHPEKLMRGADVYGAKLTDDKVREIRRLHRAGTSGEALARMFQVRPGNIRFILMGATWKHVKEADAAIPSLQQATLILPSR